MIYLADVLIHRMSSALEAMSPASTAPCLRSGIKQEKRVSKRSFEVDLATLKCLTLEDKVQVITVYCNING